MRGWEGALRRYSEPSRSLSGGEEVSSQTDVGCGLHSPPPAWESREAGERARRKSSSGHQTELAPAGGVGARPSQQRKAPSTSVRGGLRP